MQHCQEHWDKLRKGLEDRGLSSLISKNGEAVAKNLIERRTQGDTKDTYDPLMDIFFMHFGKAVEMFNTTALTEEFGCPICYSIKYYVDETKQTTKDEVEKFWVDTALDAVHEYCKEKNFCPAVQ